LEQPNFEPQGAADRIASRDLGRLSGIADTEAGIQLGSEKADFVVSRVGPRLGQLGMIDFGEYCDLLESPSGKDEVRVFLEAIATHTTSFFREKGQFDWLLETGFAQLRDRKSGEITIWSAACSTGQELYTAIIAADRAAATTLPGLRVKGIGTDLSREVVQTAKRAVYSSAEVAGIPADLRPDSLLSSKSGDGRCRIVPRIRERTEWRLGNLTKRETLSQINADIAFLRNVLIYFDEETQVDVLRNVVSRIKPGGFLMTGHSETSQVRQLGLTVIKPTIYRKESH
jgi:chemotaxis protein methyltransferase CheR